MPVNHPAAAEEQRHLQATLDVVAMEREVALKEKANAEGELSTARMYDPDALPLRELLYSRALQTLKNMDLAAKKPYFTRIDFTETGGEKAVYYIGKYGVTRSDSHEVEVIDWRAPVANLYYSGQIGPMHYVAPDGEVTGELTLKRQLGIEMGELQTIFDTDLVSQDAYLQSVLGAMTGDRLREIVTTIQAEQNFVIRHPWRKSLVVQGVAGSGKTTIALHRIAYLLYAFRETLRPEHMLILAPNPLFLNFIAGVLPDLGVDQVRQSTFPMYMESWLEQACPPIDRSDRLDKVLAMPVAEIELVSRIARTKGSLRIEPLVNRWLDAFEKRYVPKESIVFGPVRLYSHDELEHFLLVDEKPFPMARRMKEFHKQLKAAAKAATRQLCSWFTAECDKRAAAICEQEIDQEEMRRKLRRLYESRDERLAQTKAQTAPFIKKTMASFPDLNPRKLYREFWQDMLESNDPDIALAARHTCDRFEKKLPLEPEDVAPLALMAMRLIELAKPDIRHIVIDEAQDFSPLEIQLLRRVMPGATMTIVGDLMQGVNGWRGLRDWSEITDGVLENKAVMHYLVTSYRNTIEIMQIAMRVADSRPTAGQQTAKPVLRHGEEPSIERVDGMAARCKAVENTIRLWKGEGIATIAVIARTDKELRALKKALPDDLNATVLNVNEAEYAGGLVLAHAGAVKGLEFDGVILLNASAEAYGDRDLDARLLYVCLTRALHRLAIYYEGELSPLLRPRNGQATGI